MFYLIFLTIAISLGANVEYELLHTVVLKKWMRSEKPQHMSPHSSDVL